MELGKPITRREFLKFCAKGAVAAILWSIAPVDFSWAKDLEGKKKFTIRIKPFNVLDLYRNNDWAG